MCKAECLYDLDSRGVYRWPYRWHRYRCCVDKLGHKKSHRKNIWLALNALSY